jgi:hypothetical protein
MQRDSCRVSMQSHRACMLVLIKVPLGRSASGVYPCHTPPEQVTLYPDSGVSLSVMQKMRSADTLVRRPKCIWATFRDCGTSYEQC